MFLALRVEYCHCKRSDRALLSIKKKVWLVKPDFKGEVVKTEFKG